MTPLFDTVEITPSGLYMRWTNGASHTFHPLWLRESSTDPEYRDPGTKMRIPEATDIALDVTVEKFVLSADGQLQLTFCDQHECQFKSSELLHAASHLRPVDLSGEQRYWDASLSDYKTYQYDSLLEDESLILAALNEVGRTGFVKVEGIPTEPDALFEFARLVGPPRETNWGTVTDVRNIPKPYDLTMTARALSPHVDNPYRMPGPGYIFMHCLRNDADGGESTIVDGFGMARRLRNENREAFDTLTTVMPNFRHDEAMAILEDSGPLINLDPCGMVNRIRFSNRTEQVPALQPKVLERYYSARQAFAELIFAQENTFVLKLQPGDGFIWDNYRLLHGRKAFDTSKGDRHMRHCYLDRDTVSSRQKCLHRKYANTADE